VEKSKSLQWVIAKHRQNFDISLLLITSAVGAGGMQPHLLSKIIFVANLIRFVEIWAKLRRNLGKSD